MSQVPGGFSDQKAADEEIQKICDEVKPQAEKKTGRAYDVFNALLYKTQVVSGSNFLIKVNVGIGQHLHMTVYQNLSGEKTVTAVEEDHTKEDPLVPL